MLSVIDKIDSPLLVEKPPPLQQTNISLRWKILFYVSCGAASTVALYYLIEFIIECTKNPYL